MSYFSCVVCVDFVFVGISGDIIRTLKDNGKEYTWGNVTVRLGHTVSLGVLRRLLTLLMRRGKSYFPPRHPIVNKVSSYLKKK